MKVLSSKRQSVGNREYWWYNLSSPDDWLDTERSIRLILHGENGDDYLGSIHLSLTDGDWLDRIRKASNHKYNGRKIVKIHVFKRTNDKSYSLYFGRVGDGVYPVKLLK
jgi:hypothetical protein